MSGLEAFLHPVSLVEEKEVVISNRFRDADGNPVPFRIKSISQEENEAISKRCRKVRKVDGRKEEYFDGLEYNRRLIVACTAYPDFSDAQLCSAYGVMDPLMVPAKMLLGGEYAALLNAILELCGFNQMAIEQAEEVKN